MNEERLDDIDRLFARLERAAVPAEFTRSVLAHTVRHGAMLQWPWLVAALLALALLSVAGYLAGASLAASDGLDVLGALLSDATVLTTAPGDALAALGEVMPWHLVAVAGVCAALMVWASGRVLARAPAVT